MLPFFSSPGIPSKQAILVLFVYTVSGLCLQFLWTSHGLTLGWICWNSHSMVYFLFSTCLPDVNNKNLNFLVCKAYFAKFNQRNEFFFFFFFLLHILKSCKLSHSKLFFMLKAKLGRFTQFFFLFKWAV